MKKIFFGCLLLFFALTIFIFARLSYFSKSESQIGGQKNVVVEKEKANNDCKYIENANVLPPELFGKKVVTNRDVVTMERVDPEVVCSPTYSEIGRVYNDYDGYNNGMTEKEYLSSEGIKFLSVPSGSVYELGGAFTLYDQVGTFEVGPSFVLYLILKDEKGIKYVTGGYHVYGHGQLPENYWETFVLQDSLVWVK
jgi:hypothetical protein